MLGGGAINRRDPGDDAFKGGDPSMFVLFHEN